MIMLKIIAKLLSSTVLHVGISTTVSSKTSPNIRIGLRKHPGGEVVDKGGPGGRQHRGLQGQDNQVHHSVHHVHSSGELMKKGMSKKHSK